MKQALQSLIQGFVTCGAAALLLLSASSAMAAEPAKQGVDNKGQPFNHITTGFPLSGAHATAECATCHVGGVFKGTPRDCAGCHTKGKRIVATPMSTRHIPVNQPCEVCHTNAVTFYGVKFSHASGQVKPGNCAACHNGVIAAGKPANHNTGKKATDSCDTCHRTSAWAPASFNHINAQGLECNSSGCHTNGTAVQARDGTGITIHNDARLSALTCRSCHKTYSSFYTARYDHAGASTTCTACHALPVGHSGGATTDACTQCHTSGTTTWRGALGAKPANHIPYDAGVNCSNCHSANMSGPGLHGNLASKKCYECHGSNSPAYLGKHDKAPWPSYHEKSKNANAADCSDSGCHRPAGSKGVAYIKWD